MTYGNILLIMMAAQIIQQQAEKVFHRTSSILTTHKYIQTYTKKVQYYRSPFSHISSINHSLTVKSTCSKYFLSTQGSKSWVTHAGRLFELVQTYARIELLVASTLPVLRYSLTAKCHFFTAVIMNITQLAKFTSISL